MERINYTIYARYSSDLQNPRSADDQVAAILDDVNRRNPGWVHCPQYPAFKDEAVSGTAIAGRSAFKQMVRVAESPDCPFNTVIVEDISRFARNRKDSFDNRNELFIHGVTLLSMADGYADETTEAGLWLTGIKEIKAEADSRETGRRVRRGQIAQVKRDFWPGGAIPFGYRRKPVFSKTEKDIDGNSKRIGVTLKIRQAEAKIVRRVFHLYADRGMGSTRICSQLNRQGYRNRNGQMFNSSFIGAVLRNTIYVGTLTYNKTREVKHPNGKRRKKPNPPEEWIIRENAVPAIIDRATWDKAQQKIKEKQRIGRSFHGESNGGVSRPHRITLLSGLIKCPVCGQNYYMQRCRGKYRYYACGGRHSRGDSFCNNRFRIRADELHGLVLDAIDNRLLREEAIQYMEQRMKEFLEEFLSSSEGERQRLLSQKSKVNTSISRYVTAIDDEGIDLKEVHDKLEHLRTECTRIESRLNLVHQMTQERDKVLAERVIQNRALASKERIRTIEDEALLHQELKKYVDFIEIGQNGRILMKGKRTGLLEDTFFNMSVSL